MANKLRTLKLKSGTEILLGKNSESNDALMREFENKENIILHTSAPGSPFCVLQSANPRKKEIKEAAAVCASYSQDWRDNKGDVLVDVFTGKQIFKEKDMKAGTWKVNKSKKIKVKKREIEKLENN